MSTDADLVKQIRAAIEKLDTIGVVNLGHHDFDRIPCSRRRIYALAKMHAHDWGYDYHTAEYIPSGNRPFQRNHKRGQYRKPSLFKWKKS